MGSNRPVASVERTRQSRLELGSTLDGSIARRASSTYPRGSGGSAPLVASWCASCAEPCGALRSRASAGCRRPCRRASGEPACRPSHRSAARREPRACTPRASRPSASRRHLAGEFAPAACSSWRRGRSRLGRSSRTRRPPRYGERTGPLGVAVPENELVIARSAGSRETSDLLVTSASRSDAISLRAALAFSRSSRRPGRPRGSDSDLSAAISSRLSSENEWMSERRVTHRCSPSRRRTEALLGHDQSHLGIRTPMTRPGMAERAPCARSLEDLVDIHHRFS